MCLDSHASDEIVPDKGHVKIKNCSYISPKKKKKKNAVGTHKSKG